MNYIAMSLSLIIFLLYVVLMLGILMISRKAEIVYNRMMQDKIKKDNWDKVGKTG